MQQQVAKIVTEKLREWEKQAEKIKTSKNFDPHELSIAVKQIRYFQGILHDLAVMTADAVKALWYKFVKKD